MLRDRISQRLARSDRAPWIITWVVLTGAFAVSLTITILAVSRPAIARDLRTDAASLVWLISGPILATAMSGATAGRLGDLRGHRRVYLVGMVGAAVFALLSALASGAVSLIVFRVLGALIGAATTPSSMAIINLEFPPEKRSSALGYWSLVVAGGPVVGLVIGGPLVDAFGWRAIFVIQAPLLAVAAVVAWLVLPETERAPGTTFDVAGNLTLVISVTALLAGIDRGRPWGWSAPPVIALFVLSVASFGLFVRIESRAAAPLIPLHWFARRSFSIPIFVQFFAQFGYMGGFILAPKLLADVAGASASTSSWMMVPRPLTFAVAGAVSGYLVPRIGIRRYAIVGTGCIVASMAMIAGIARDPVIWVMLLAIALSGLGMGAAQPAIATSVANSVDDADLGVAGATQQLVSQLGTSIGMNLLDTIQVAAVPTAGVGGSFVRAYVVGAAITAGGMALGLLLPRPPGRGRTLGTPLPLDG